VILFGTGDEHPTVGWVKRKLGVYPNDDYFSEALASRVRGAQQLLGMEVTGLIEDDLIKKLRMDG